MIAALHSGGFPVIHFPGSIVIGPICLLSEAVGYELALQFAHRMS